MSHNDKLAILVLASVTFVFVALSMVLHIQLVGV